LWNQLEYANASMTDEARAAMTLEERELVHDVLEAFDRETRPWTNLDELERAVLAKLVAGESPRLKQLQRQLEICHVRNRERTGHGFFTTLDVDHERAEPIDLASGSWGDVVAEMEGLEHGAGFLLTIAEGYLHELEGYSFEEPWPAPVTGSSLSYNQVPRDIPFS
jgi:hypothetical protein